MPYANSFIAGKHCTALTFSKEQVCFYLKCREVLLLSISVTPIIAGCAIIHSDKHLWVNFRVRQSSYLLLEMLNQSSLLIEF